MITLHKIKLITKPFWIPAITAIYLSLAKFINPLVIIALGFGYIGDLLLMKNKKRWFITGAVSFLIGHLFYIAVFLKDAGGLTVIIEHPFFCGLTFIPYIIYAIILKKVLGENVKSVFLPAVLYLSVLLLMSYTSLIRFWGVNSAAFILTFSGSILFIISDSLIAVRKLKTKFRGIGTLIVITYITAQILIILGITAA